MYWDIVAHWILSLRYDSFTTIFSLDCEANHALLHYYLFFIFTLHLRFPLRSRQSYDQNKGHSLVILIHLYCMQCQISHRFVMYHSEVSWGMSVAGSTPWCWMSAQQLVTEYHHPWSPLWHRRLLHPLAPRLSRWRRVASQQLGPKVEQLLTWAAALESSLEFDG